MECMACSDNVVRAGLTPKYRDVHTLCEMLDYTGKPANKTKFPGKSVTENGVTITTFSPPIRDFAVKKFQVIVIYAKSSCVISPYRGSKRFWI